MLFRSGRVYIPVEDLDRFHHVPADFSPDHMKNGVQAERYVPLLTFQAQRAREFYAAAERLIPLIDEDSRPCLWALVEIYRRLLDKITAQHFNVFEKKVRLSVPEKLLVLSRGLAKVVF